MLFDQSRMDDYLHCSLFIEEKEHEPQYCPDLSKKISNRSNRLQSIQHSPLAQHVLQERLWKNISETISSPLENVKSYVESKVSDEQLGDFSQFDCDRNHKLNVDPSQIPSCTVGFVERNKSDKKTNWENQIRTIEIEEHPTSESESLCLGKCQMELTINQTNRDSMLIFNECEKVYKKSLISLAEIGVNGSAKKSEDTKLYNKTWWITKSSAVLLMFQGIFLILFTLFIR